LVSAGKRRADCAPPLIADVRSRLERYDVETYLPFLLAVAGFIVAALLSERAITKLSVEQKAQVLDTFSVARKIHLFVIVAFVLSVLWWPVAAWTLIAAYFVGAAIWGARKLAGLRLPQPAYRYFLAGQLTVAAGVVACAAVVITRST
jgi:hypothetical protein